MGATAMDPKKLAAALAEYEAENEFVRQVLLPVEDRIRYMPQAKWEGGYRWFRSPNVVCLEKYRRLKAAANV
jgi:hypothetical protein